MKRKARGAEWKKEEERETRGERNGGKREKRCAQKERDKGVEREKREK